jgi:hypothetical protein
VIGHPKSTDTLKLAIFLASGPVASYVLLLASPLGPGLTTQNTILFRPFGPAMSGVVHDFWDDVNVYLPSGQGILVVLGAVVAFFRKPRIAIVVAAAIAVTIVPWLLLSRIGPSRYYLPAIPFACSFGAIAFVYVFEAAKRAHQVLGGIAAVALIAVAIASGADSFRQATDPRHAALTVSDDWQFRIGWQSGYGYQEARDYLATTAEPGSVIYYVVQMRHLAGSGADRPLPPDVVAYGVTDTHSWQPDLSRSPSYFVIDDLSGYPVGAKVNEVSAYGLNLRQIARFPRLGTNEGVYVFRVP